MHTLPSFSCRSNLVACKYAAKESVNFTLSKVVMNTLFNLSTLKMLSASTLPSPDIRDTYTYAGTPLRRE